MLKLTFTFLLSILFVISGHSQTKNKPDKNFHLYILMGQSNMAGRGIIESDLISINHPNVYMLNQQGEWQVAKHPVHFDKPSISGVGPGLSFGIEMAKKDSNIKIGLIPCAVGGTSIEKWKENAYDEATKTHPYDDAVIRIKNVMQYGFIKGMLWHQGEANSGNSDQEKYLKNLEDLIFKVRVITKKKKLPVVIGELGQFNDRYLNFNKTLALVPYKIPYTALATSENLTHKGDHIHFNGTSANEYGERFASKMKELQAIE